MAPAFSAVTYKGIVNAVSPELDRVIKWSTNGSDEVAAFLRRAFGYCLTGVTDAEVLFMLIGKAATGKTTILEGLKHALGDYAATAETSTFLERDRQGGPKNDIARLKGKRLVVASEVKEKTPAILGVPTAACSAEKAGFERFISREVPTEFLVSFVHADPEDQRQLLVELYDQEQPRWLRWHHPSPPKPRSRSTRLRRCRFLTQTGTRPT